MGDNIQQFLNASGTLDTARHDALWQDLDFAESNKMHGCVWWMHRCCCKVQGLVSPLCGARDATDPQLLTPGPLWNP